MRWRQTFAVAVLVVLASACEEQEPLTEIVVVVDTDIPGVERITVSVANFTDERVAEATLRDVAPVLPRTVGLVHEGGPLGPITVTARAIDRDRTENGVVVEQRARLYFQAERIVRLDMMLTQSCVNMYTMCTGGDTCLDGVCGSPDVSAGDLAPWSGRTVSHLLSGSADDEGASAGGDAPVGTGDTGAAGAAGGAPAANDVPVAGSSGAPEVPTPDAGTPGGGIDAGDAPATDAGPAPTPDASSPPLGCLALDPTTIPAECHATNRTCVGALCNFECEDGFGNCDLLAINGCEADLMADARNCGSCGNACPANPPNAECSCVAGARTLQCDSIIGLIATHADCDDDIENGCETDLDTDESCGECGRQCACSNFTCGG